MEKKTGKEMNKEVKKDRQPEFPGEDSTKYGEFISSFDGWITPDKQREKAKEHEKKR